MLKKLSNLKHRIVKTLSDQLYQDQTSWILWLVVSFGSGILTYFSLAYEPTLLLIIGITGTILFIFYLLKNTIYIWLINILLFFCLGIDAAKLRTIYIDSPKLVVEMQEVKISGIISDIATTLKGKQVVLEKLYISGLDRSTVPKKAKITINGNNTEFQVGDIIKCKANLKPPSSPIVPGGYNFALQHYFDQIGATGYAISKIYVIKHNKSSFWNYISNLRLEIAKRIKDSLGQKTGSIAAALIMGEQSSIDKNILSDMRISGLTHILSVSGLHLSMVSIICFFTIRLLLSFSLYLGQNYDSKKIASYISLIITLGYLLISGMQIAAIRSYIMVVCIIIAILLDRQENALRSVFLAAFVMMLLTPEVVLHPSFQMSFFAVIALVSGYEYYLSMFFSNKEHNIVSKVRNYFIGSLAATFIAGLATAPFAIYHFNQYSNYSLLANLIISPVTSFIIMPMVMLTCLFYPFHLENISLSIMEIGIKIMLKIANWISQFPSAMLILPNMNNNTLLLLAFGLLWLCIWQRGWRLLGMIPIFVAICMLLTTNSPIMLIDAKSSTIFVRSNDGNLIKAGNSRISPFMSDYLNAKMQTRTIYNITEKRYIKEFGCTSGWCNYHEEIFFPINNDAKHTDLLYNTAKQSLLSKTELQDNGSYFVYLQSNMIKLVSVNDNLAKRPWN